MNIITIGGTPAAGKTTLGKKLGKCYKCLSLELELKRFEFIKNDLKNNAYEYTSEYPKDNENLRDYYLRMCIYDKKINKETMMNWQIATSEYINIETNKIIDELNNIILSKDNNRLIKFISNNKDIINYCPKNINIDILQNLIISHCLISRFDVYQIANEKIDLNTDLNECINRFKKRENINNSNYDEEIKIYLESYKDVLNVDKIQDARIKNDNFNYHQRVVALIKQNNKYLIQNIDGYNYFILPGGHVHLGENSINAIKREVREEVGIEIKNIKLVCLHENFYKNKGRQEHWVEMYFKVTPLEKLEMKDFVKIENDNGDIKKLNFSFKTREEIANIDLKPSDIKELIINGKDNKFNYLIREVK